MLVTSIILISILTVGSAQANTITLAQEGRSLAVIVTADEPSPAARQAATDLQMWLRQASGATLSIQKESELPESTNGNLILVGDTKRTRSLGILPDDFGLEEILLRSFPGVLVITGDDERPDGVKLKGTLFAVDAFAEEILRVRLLWPGDLGEIVPHYSTIKVTDVNIREKPRLVRRDVFNQGYNGVILTKLDALGWDREEYRKFQKTSDLWFRFYRFGGSYNGNFGHAFGDYWKRFHKDHPDWFAMQPDGSRDNSQPDYALYPSHRLCVSNPGLIKQVAKDSIQKLKKNPTLDAVSVSPNDGGPQTFCLCKQCESWDAPEGKTIYMRSKKGRIPHVSLTDRFVRFYSEVAKLVTKELPNRYIGAYAYSYYTSAPIHATLHRHVVIGFVSGTKMYLNEAARQEMRDNWSNWSKKAQKLFLYSNSLRALHALPTVYVHRLGEDLRFYADHKILFAQYDCQFQHWATNGLNYYVLAKLLWDPYRDVDEIVDEYCEVGFGPAAEAIHRYFDKIEQITTDIANERKSPSNDTLIRYYTDDTLASLNHILDEAGKEADGDSTVKKRIAFLRRGLQYAPICRDYRAAEDAATSGNKWLRRKYFEESVRRTTWFQKLGPSWVIHVPWLIYQDW